MNRMQRLKFFDQKSVTVVTGWCDRPFSYHGRASYRISHVYVYNVHWNWSHAVFLCNSMAAVVQIILYLHRCLFMVLVTQINAQWTERENRRAINYANQKNTMKVERLMLKNRYLHSLLYFFISLAYACSLLNQIKKRNWQWTWK